MFDENSFGKINNKFDDSMVDNVIELRRKPTNIIEIIDAVKEYKEIKSKEKDISDSMERNIYKVTNKEHLSELFGFVGAGVMLDECPLQDGIVQNMSSFLNKYGIDESVVVEGISNTHVFLSDVWFTSGTDAYECSNEVYFDYRKANFDETGKFIGFKEEETDFVSHVLTHEFFHVLSRSKNDSISLKDDALSEGFTEMLTEMATGKKYTKAYGFPVSVCSLFRDIMGMDRVLDDYLNSLVTLPNLRGLFLECGVSEEEFNSFHADLNNILHLTLERNPEKSEFIANEQARCAIFLRERIVEPYCQNHPERAEEVKASFGRLFPDQVEKEPEHVR